MRLFHNLYFLLHVKLIIKYKYLKENIKCILNTFFTSNIKWKFETHFLSSFLWKMNGNFNIAVPGSDTYGKRGVYIVIVPIFNLNKSVY